MVDFCPKCEKLLRKQKIDDQDYLKCPSCDYKVLYSKTSDKKTGKASRLALEKKITDNKTRVLDTKSDSMELKPKTNVECPKCHNREAFFEQYQTRSADEPATTFYSCTKCNHRWREY